MRVSLIDYDCDYENFPFSEVVFKERKKIISSTITDFTLNLALTPI